MIGETLFFYIFALMAMVSAFLVVQRKNPMSSAMCLILTFFAVAGLFVLLSAHLLAALQILVYAGAIMVLILFVIMLLDLKDENIVKERWTPAKVLAIAAAAGLVLIFRGIPRTQATFPELPSGFGSIERIAGLLYSRYALPLEIAGLLLLIAIVGVVIIGKWRAEE
jgi:NADH-quinone oxidoreductase subunit J